MCECVCLQKHWCIQAHLLQISLAYLDNLFYLSFLCLSIPLSLSTGSDIPDWSVGPATRSTTPPFDTIDK